MKTRRSVSPVVATLLLILIAVAASIIVYTWVTGLSASVKGTGTSFNQRFSIESGDLSLSEGKIVLYIRNTGEADISLNGAPAYVYGSDGTLVEALTLTGPTAPLKPGKVASYTASIETNRYEAGTYYRVVVTLPTGFEDSILLRAHK